MKAALILCMLLAVGSAAAIPLCGDGICDKSETYFSCPHDCPSASADGYCDNVLDHKCDADCKGSDPDCPGAATAVVSNGNSKQQILAVAVLVAVLIIIGIIIRKVATIRSEKDLENKLRSKYG